MPVQCPTMIGLQEGKPIQAVLLLVSITVHCQSPGHCRRCLTCPPIARQPQIISSTAQEMMPHFAPSLRVNLKAVAGN